MSSRDLVDFDERDAQITGGPRHLRGVGSRGKRDEDGGFYYTSFIVDPKEDMIVISMAQLHPTGGLALDAEVRVLADQALTD